MKNKLFLSGMVGLMLVFGLVLTACPTEADEGGNDTSGTNNPPPSTNPFVGAVWIAWDERAPAVNYQFTTDMVYSTADTNVFNPKGSYTYDVAQKELTLFPSSGENPKTMTYTITGSLLEFNKGSTNAQYYTKNPITGGSFNGSNTGSIPIIGIWQNEEDQDYILGFNDAKEYFFPSGRTNKEGKPWWDVIGTYTYTENNATKYLTLRHHVHTGEIAPENYTIELLLNGRQMKLIETDSEDTIFNKQDRL